MEIRDVGSNSFKSKEQKNDDDTKRTPRVAPVATGTKVKKSKTSKIADIFFPEGINTEDIWDYILRERLAPGLMSGIRNLLDDVLDGIFGTPGRSYRRGDIYRRDDRYTPYSSISSLYRSSDTEREKDKDRWRKKTYSYDEISYPTRAQAEEVLDAMEDALDRFKVVTVGDLYDFSRIEANPTDWLYGWTNIKSARVEKISGGRFVIVLPKASPID